MQDIQGVLQDLLSNKDQDNEQQDLVRLWDSWSQVIGSQTARLIKPLRHRNKTLVLGAKDSVTLQEASFAQEQILTEIASFLGRQPFDKIKFELLGEQIPLSDVQVGPARHPVSSRQPSKLGGLFQGQGPEWHPVISCYRAYVRFWQARPSAGAKSHREGT
jgi:hypothetical protein